jgi:hypothetical protein
MKPIREEALEYLVKKELVQRKLSELDFLSRDKQEWSKKHYAIMDDIIANGYRPNNDHPIITKDNIVMDGNHRLVMLHDLHGDDYVVTLKFVNAKYNRLLIRSILPLMWVSIKRFFKRLFKRK